MAKMDWRIGTPREDGVYLTTMKISEDDQWVVLTRFENGEWLSSGEITAWDYRPEPFSPTDSWVADNAATETYEEALEWKVRDLETAWEEIHGEMKYYEGASEALLNVIKIMAKGGE